ncbi:MAG: hypothetical protein ABI758_00600 [Candidatus Woesebacteria bacterium]
MPLVDEKYLHSSTKPKEREDRSTCLFCNCKLGKSNRKKEHVIPHWLITYLGIENLRISLTVYSPLEDKNTEERDFQFMNSFLAGGVCGYCNGGWMKLLEDTTLDILKPLIRGSREIINLSQSEKDLITKWTFKTSIVLNSATNYFKVVPPEHYNLLYEGKIPEHVLVTATMHEPSKRYSHLENNSLWMGIDNTITESELKKGGDNSYKIALQLGKLVLVTTYWADDEWVYYLVKGRHQPMNQPTKMKIKFYDDKLFSIPQYNSKDAIFYATATISISKNR